MGREDVHWLLPEGGQEVIRRLFFAIVAISLLELAILVKLGMLIGFWPMLAVVFGVGTLGIVLARSQGLRTLRAIQTDLALGRMPAPRLLDQALIMAGGVLLVLPGLLSDLAGLALVLPPTRALVKRALGKWLGRRLQQNQRGTGRAGNDISDQVNYTVVIP
jgi:UPF0716 protein FxsA